MRRAFSSHGMLAQWRRFDSKKSSSARWFLCQTARRSLKIHANSPKIRGLFDVVSSIFATSTDRDLHLGRDFTRECVLSPELLVTLLLFMSSDANRRGYRHVLDAFWDECGTHGIELPTDEPVSASALCQARWKITIELLQRVLHEAAASFAKAYPTHWTWRGRRVFAVDGSKFNLARSEELDDHFGRPAGGHCPQATVSTLMNVTSGLPCDVRIAPYGSCERSLLLEHLEVLEPGDVVILDRGYPSHAVLRALAAKGIDFLVRVPATSSFDVVDFIRNTRSNDYRVTLEPPTNAPKDTGELEVRVLRLESPSGEDTFYITSLRRAHFSAAAIGQLYRMRWQAEELFKLEKSSYFGQRQFHARHPHGVRQEILAQAIFVVIARFLQATAADVHEHDYQALSSKTAILGLAAYITRLCLDDPAHATQWLPRLLRRVVRTRDKKRPGRSCPRRSFKPKPRWGPEGRRGA